jgi:hypothetical protein
MPSDAASVAAAGRHRIVGDTATVAEPSGTADHSDSDTDGDVTSSTSSTDGGDGEDSCGVEDGEAEQAQPGEVTRPELLRRLREAVERAHVKAGRVSAVDRAAAETLAVMTARVVRKARREAAQPATRFPWQEVSYAAEQLQPAAGPLEFLTQVTGSREEAAKLMREPELPDAPPEPEPESRDGAGTKPTPLARTTQWFKEERERQAARPFAAGRVASANLTFLPGARPSPALGTYLRWGRTLRTDSLSPDARRDLARLLAKDLRSGAISVVQASDVDCVTPIFVVYHPVTMKARLVHDLRAINARLVAATAHLPRITDALMGLSFAAKLDLAQAFRHVAVGEQDRRVLAFGVDGFLLRWNALPFGASQSPGLFAAALAAVLRKLPADVRVVVYVDDVLILAPSREQLDADMLTLCKTLRSAGWSVALDKMYPYAHTCIPFLGLLVVLEGEQHLRVSKVKADKLQLMCVTMTGKVTASLRDIQRVAGLLAFFAIAVPEARLGRRGLDAAAAEAERLPGRTVGVKGQFRADLEFWAATAAALPAMPPPPAGSERDTIVCTDAAGLPSLGFGGVAWSTKVAAPDFEAALGSPIDYARKFRNDVRVGNARLFSGPLPTSAASLSSSALEVLACRRVLQLVNARTPLRGATVHWFSDSMVAVAAVTKWRAKAPGLVRELQELLAEARQMGCRIVPRWVSRDLGWQPLADALSKLKWRRDSAEWAVSQAKFREICASVGWTPTVDMFAAPGNRLTDQYCTEFPTPGAWTSAFALDWTGVRGWAFPPFSAADAMFRHMCRASNARLIAIVPRETRVPPRLRVVSRTPAPHDLRLVSAAGHTAFKPCPVPLDVVHVQTPDLTSSNG